MERKQELSAQAQRRMATMLPELLGAVRGRRRRRIATRVAAAAAVVLLLVGYWPFGDVATTTTRANPGGAAQVADAGEQQPPADKGSPVCEVVRDIPGVVARYRVAVAVNPDWFVDDGELHRLLVAAGRPAGLVRVAGKVTFSSEATDPLGAFGED